jgi:hypothetical protein
MGMKKKTNMITNKKSRTYTPKIEKGVPIPTRSYSHPRGTIGKRLILRYPFNEMEEGDMFFVECNNNQINIHRKLSALYRTATLRHISIETRQMNHTQSRKFGIGVWLKTKAK